MARLFLAVVLAGCMPTALASDVDSFTGVLDGLWTQSDVDADGELSYAEYLDAMDKLGVSESSFTSHSNSYEVLFNDLDSDSSAGLTKEELSAAATDYPEYQDVFKSAFTNGAGEVPDGVPEPTDNMVSAAVKVKMSLEVAGSPSSIYPGQRTKIKEYFADKCGVTVNDVLMTFVPKASASTMRKLAESFVPASMRRLSEDATVVDGTAFVADQAAADAAQAALPTTADEFDSIPAFSGLEVTQVEVVAVVKPDLETGPLVLVVIVVVVFGIVMCCGAQKVAKNGAKKAGAEGGCCKTGCCSFYAVKAWAGSEFLTLVAIVAGVFMVYGAAQRLTDNIVGLIDLLLDIFNSNASAIADFASSIPADLGSTLEQYRPIVLMLPLMTMGPGLLCVAFLFLSSCCPMLKAHKGSYCCTKCCIMLANLWLLVSFVFYIIFAAVAVAIKYAPPDVQSQIDAINGVCDVVPPMFRQLVVDNQAAVDQLTAAGVDTTELSAALADVSDLTTMLEDGCGYLTDLFESIFGLFLPCLMTAIFIFFALIVNNILCCATGCCKAPPAAGKVAPGGTEMASPPA